MTIADKLLHQIRLEGTIFAIYLLTKNWIIIIIDIALFQFYSIISPPHLYIETGCGLAFQKCRSE